MTIIGNWYKEDPVVPVNTNTPGEWKGRDPDAVKIETLPDGSKRITNLKKSGGAFVYAEPPKYLADDVESKFTIAASNVSGDVTVAWIDAANSPYGYVSALTPQASQQTITAAYTQSAAYNADPAYAKKAGIYIDGPDSTMTIVSRSFTP